MRNKIIILPILFLGLLPLVALADEMPGFGIGAHPLTSTTVSMWLLKKGSDGKPAAIALVYFVGSEGWHNRPWESKFEGNIQIEGRIAYQLISEDITLEVAISEDGNSVSVQSHPFDLSSSNVFIVRTVDKGPQNESIMAVGRYELPFSTTEPLSVVFLRDHKDVQKSLP